MDMLAPLLICILPALVIVAALKDVTSMTIPNWISLALLAAFLPTAWVAGLSPMEMLAHLGVGVAALIVGMGLFALRTLGGGDAKLMAAACLWLGPSAVLPFVILTALAGGALCLMLLAARAQLQPLAAIGPAWFGRLMKPNGDIPYGLAIAAGALAAYAQSALVTSAFGL